MNPIVQQSLHSRHTLPVVTDAPPANGLFGADGFTFGDLIDLVNPLQHIPIVGSYYRKWSGDEAAPAMRVAGGALFGGPLGAGFAALGLLVEKGVKAAIGRPQSTSAIAETAPAAEPTVAPGGWMVAHSRQLPREPTMPAATGLAVESPRRRGGWMVAAAYAPADERAWRATNHPGIDTRA
ncbi:MAG: hypothetical protein WD928_15005 [Gammaproteobacteria bacterium]